MSNQRNRLFMKGFWSVFVAPPLGENVSGRKKNTADYI